MTTELRRDTLAKIHLAHPQIVPRSEVNNTNQKTLDVIQKALENLPKDKKNIKLLQGFYRAFPNNEEMVALISPKKKWMVHREVAKLASPFFDTLLKSDKFIELEKKEIQIYKEDGKQYSNKVIEVLSSFLNTGNIIPFRPDIAQELFELAHQLIIPKLLKAARLSFMSCTIKEKDLIERWNWAQQFDEAGVLLLCAQAYLNFSVKKIKGFKLEFEEIKNLAEILKGLDAKVSLQDEDLKITINFYNDEVAQKLTPFLKKNGVTAIAVPQGSFSWLSQLMQDPKCTITSLELLNYNKDEIISLLKTAHLIKKLKFSSIRCGLIYAEGYNQIYLEVLNELKNNRTIKVLDLRGQKFIYIGNDILELAYSNQTAIRRLYMDESEYDFETLHKLSKGKYTSKCRTYFEIDKS